MGSSFARVGHPAWVLRSEITHPSFARMGHPATYLAQWCAKSITTAIIQIGTTNNHRRPLLHCRQRRISRPQIAFSRRNTAQIGKTPIAQTNGSPVMEWNPIARSCGFTQACEAHQRYRTTPITFRASRIKLVLCVSRILVVTEDSLDMRLWRERAPRGARPSRNSPHRGRQVLRGLRATSARSRRVRDRGTGALSQRWSCGIVAWKIGMLRDVDNPP